MDEFSCDVNEAAAAICRYLADHPHAADTARGIAQIWLRQRIRWRWFKRRFGGSRAGDN